MDRGRRPTYYSKCRKFRSSCIRETTDVVGVGESLPFEDGVFDAVFSLNNSEHVRDPLPMVWEPTVFEILIYGFVFVVAVNVQRSIDPSSNR